MDFSDKKNGVIANQSLKNICSNSECRCLGTNQNKTMSQQQQSRGKKPQPVGKPMNKPIHKAIKKTMGK